MACEFKMIHRVEFADTDLAGIMHFANFFRLMERTEHAFFRSLGLSIHMEEGGRLFGWPRVRAACEYKNPLRFEEEVEVHLIVREKRPKSLTYDFIFRKMDGERPGAEVARGSMTAVCVAVEGQTGKMKAATIPERVARCIEAAPSDLSGA